MMYVRYVLYGIKLVTRLENLRPVSCVLRMTRSCFRLSFLFFFSLLEFQFEEVDKRRKFPSE